MIGLLTTLHSKDLPSGTSRYALVYLQYPAYTRRTSQQQALWGAPTLSLLARLTNRTLDPLSIFRAAMGISDAPV